MNNAITDVENILVGHADDRQALTGCTVILCPQGATGGVDQRGGAPGTRETDLLRPMHLVDNIHAVVLAGGSAFGLDAATGVMRYLEERGFGYDTGPARVPLVAGAILYDLGIGSASVRPDAQMGYQACLNATAQPPQQGCAGAGMGASVGKILGMGQAMKGGIGTSSIQLGGDGLVVGAIVAVNALGDVVDPQSGQILAGARTRQDGARRLGAGPTFADTYHVMEEIAGRKVLHFYEAQNTVIGVVATNAILTKDQANKVAQMAQDGLALAVRPAHTMLDGDTLFCLATNQVQADVNIVGAFAARATAQAILNAVRFAAPMGGLPAASNL